MYACAHGHMQVNTYTYKHIHTYARMYECTHTCTNDIACVGMFVLIVCMHATVLFTAGTLMIEDSFRIEMSLFHGVKCTLV